MIDPRKIKSETVPVDQIRVGERFRADTGDLSTLKKDIERRGLIHPLAVIRREDGYELAAGGRRLAAITELGWSEVPVRLFNGNLNEHDLRSIELAENIHRKDLTWQEESSLTKHLHALQQEEHGKDRGSGWSVEDTASLLGVNRTTVSRNVELANATELIPELKECKTKSEAHRTLNRMKERYIREERAEQAKKQEDSRHKRLRESYIVGDFLEKQGMLEDGSIDVVEFDPPFFSQVSVEKRADDPEDVATYIKDGKVDRGSYVKWLGSMLDVCWRKLKPDGWMLLWSHIKDIPLTAELLGDKPWGLIVWVKSPRNSNAPFYYLKASFEPLFYIRKPEAKLLKLGGTNIFARPCVTEWSHPSEKPIELMMDLLPYFAYPKAKVLVPCARSGSTLLACANLGMIGIGFDICETFKRRYDVRVSEGEPGSYRSL